MILVEKKKQKKKTQTTNCGACYTLFISHLFYNAFLMGRAGCGVDLDFNVWRPGGDVVKNQTCKHIRNPCPPAGCHPL